MLLLSIFGTTLLAILGAYIFGRTRAPDTYDVWDAVRPCPTCRRLMIPGGQGLEPICWPCRSRPPVPLPPPIEVSR
jgi:hypothetical protein